MKRTFSISQVSMLTGCGEAWIRTMMAAGLVIPHSRSGKRGRGRAIAFDARTLVTVGLLKTLRRAGATLEYAGPLARFLNTLTPEEIEQAAADGMILVYAGAAIPPRLLRPGDQVEVKTTFQALGFQTEVAALWDRVKEGLRFFDRATAVLN